MTADIQRVFDANFGVYGVRKVWRQLGREGKDVARCTVARLMRRMGLQGVVRGRDARTTISNPAALCPLDRVNRQVHAPRPNALWLSDFTYVATWQGFVYVAFVVEPRGLPDIDTYARRIVGWRVSRTAHAAFGLDALEQASVNRRPVRGAAWYITATVGLNTSAFTIVSAWHRQALSPPSAASVTATIVSVWMLSGGPDSILRLTSCHCIDVSALRAAPAGSQNVAS